MINQDNSVREDYLSLENLVDYRTFLVLSNSCTFVKLPFFLVQEHFMNSLFSKVCEGNLHDFSATDMFFITIHEIRA